MASFLVNMLVFGGVLTATGCLVAWSRKFVQLFSSRSRRALKGRLFAPFQSSPSIELLPTHNNTSLTRPLLPSGSTAFASSSDSPRFDRLSIDTTPSPRPYFSSHMRSRSLGSLSRAYEPTPYMHPPTASQRNSMLFHTASDPAPFYSSRGPQHAATVPPPVIPSPRAGAIHSEHPLVEVSGWQPIEEPLRPFSNDITTPKIVPPHSHDDLIDMRETLQPIAQPHKSEQSAHSEDIVDALDTITPAGDARPSEPSPPLISIPLVHTEDVEAGEGFSEWQLPSVEEDVPVVHTLAPISDDSCEVAPSPITPLPSVWDSSGSIPLIHRSWETPDWDIPASNVIRDGEAPQTIKTPILDPEDPLQTPSKPISKAPLLDQEGASPLSPSFSATEEPHLEPHLSTEASETCADAESIPSPQVDTVEDSPSPTVNEEIVQEVEPPNPQEEPPMDAVPLELISAQDTAVPLIEGEGDAEVSSDDPPEMELRMDSEVPDPDLLPLPDVPMISLDEQDKESMLSPDAQPIELATSVSRPDWSARALDVPPVGLPSANKSPASDTVTLPGSFPPSVELQTSGPIEKPVTQESVAIVQEARKSRSAIDFALAIQLRPGIGIGSDAAWMVRFLMSAFGWLAVLVARTQTEYTSF